MIFDSPTYKMAKCDVTDYHVTPILAIIGFKKRARMLILAPSFFI
jgi:hypothetical protein